jgi:hypothetical protein
METKHSPGPWIFCGNHVDDAMGLTILRAHCSFDEMNPYDVRLAAAAPELLEACRVIMREIESIDGAADPCVRLWSDVVRAAIAKAEGGHP